MHVANTDADLEVPEDEFVEDCVKKILPVYQRKTSTPKEFWTKSQKWVNSEINKRVKPPTPAIQRGISNATPGEDKQKMAEARAARVAEANAAAEEDAAKEDTQDDEPLRDNMVEIAANVYEKALGRNVDESEVQAYLQNKGLQQNEIVAARERAQARLKQLGGAIKGILAFKAAGKSRLSPQLNSTAAYGVRSETAELGIDETTPTDI